MTEQHRTGFSSSEFLSRREVNLHNIHIIQGGMGVGVSGYSLARKVAIAGEKHDVGVMGTVSGTALPVVMAYRLQEGNLRVLEALKDFDRKFSSGIGGRIIDKYYKDSRHKNGHEVILPPKPQHILGNDYEKQREITEMAIAAAYVEVDLAKLGHKQPIAINVLEKLQMMHLPTIYGAILAGVDVVIAGAGLPTQFPKMIDTLSKNQVSEYVLSIRNENEEADKFVQFFNPQEFVDTDHNMNKPKFLAIVSSYSLARWFTRTEGIDGFIGENYWAGGHNAPYNEGEPDIEKILSLGLPVWNAGGKATPEILDYELSNSVTGLQLGTVFALSSDSGFPDEVKKKFITEIMQDALKIETDDEASPSGYAIKKVRTNGSLSEDDIREQAKKICSLGYLVDSYKRNNGELGFRCPAEPEKSYMAKGGDSDKIEGKVCLCRGLVSALGYGASEENPPFYTLGTNIQQIKPIVERFGPDYTAEDVIIYIANK